MHASGESTPATMLKVFKKDELQTGCAKQGQVYLTADKILIPSVAPSCIYEYNLISDCVDNSYHQCAWWLCRY